MSMNFNRYLCQEFIETEVGCSDPAQLQLFKEQIKSYSLPVDKVTLLSEAIVNDATDVFYKSSISFLEALYSLKRGHSSWAIVKLYYSVFYSLRAHLLLNGFAPVKNGKGEIYLIKCEANAVPFRISTSSVKGDHKTTIKAFGDLFSTHRLNTNKIDSYNIFEWAMQCRELVNYRNSSFIEPGYGYEAIPGLAADCSQIDHLLKQYVTNEYYTFCFDKEHSLLSTATVLLNEDVLLFRENNIQFIGEERMQVMKQLLKKAKLSGSNILNGLFCVESDVRVSED